MALTDDDPRASDEPAVPAPHADTARERTHIGWRPGAPGEQSYEHPLVAVDVVILTMRRRRLEALLIKRRRWPYEGLRALPGSFVRGDESLEDAARRVLERAAGVRDVYLEQLYTFGDPQRDPRARVITVVYYALLRADALPAALAGSTGVIGSGEDAAELTWFPVDALPPLAFDHAEILRYTLQRLRGKLEYTRIGFQLLAPEFTLSELQEVYDQAQRKKEQEWRHKMKTVKS